MTVHPLAAFLLSAWLAASAARAAGNDPEKIPPDAPRHVVGVWRLKTSPCTRSIEQVAGRHFIVARCPQLEGVDGSVGIPLTQESAQAYRNRSGVVYEVQADGRLLVKIGSEVFDEGLPHRDTANKDAANKDADGKGTGR